MPGKLIVRGAYRSDKPGADGLQAAFDKFLQQIERDVIAGTFDNFDASIFPNKAAFGVFKKQTNEVSRAFSELDAEGLENGRFQFRLELDSALFADPDYGLQRLVHTLASDLFERRVHDYSGKIAVSSIEFGGVRDAMVAAYRPVSYTRADIRAAFALKENRPLLAFSLKPRGCLSDDDYVHIVTAAFDKGCSIVELDTRDLVIDQGARLALFQRLTKLGLDLSKERICRFAANVSGPARIVGPTLEALAKMHIDHNPDAAWVVKVDGNLDGLSTIQAIRSGCYGLPKQPIITCYPVLKYAMQSALGRNAFVEMLAMSGADIIYPGQSPDFGFSNNRIEPEVVAAAQSHYQKMADGDFPMLSVAGGIFINSVHACLSLLGPDVAFFAGGGIALSKKGIAEGADNFAEAIELSCQDLFDGKQNKGLKDKLIDLSRIYFEDGKIPADYELILPASLKNVPLVAESTNLKA
jgi:hypothetical protein